MPRVILMVVLVALALYAVLDCARTPQDQMPGRLPKALWLMIILVFATTIAIGPLAWIICSRVSRAEDSGGVIPGGVWSSSGESSIRFSRRSKQTPDRSVAPDDDPEFLAQLSKKMRDQQRKEYERKKRQQQDGLQHSTDNADSNTADTPDDGTDTNSNNRAKEPPKD